MCRTPHHIFLKKPQNLHLEGASCHPGACDVMHSCWLHLLAASLSSNKR